MDSTLINAQEKDLLGRMLERNPQNRISAQACLDHPFFKQEVPDLTFKSDDFGQIESEFDVQQQDNHIQK